VGVDVAWNREPLTRIAVGSPFGSLSFGPAALPDVQASDERSVSQGYRAGVL